MALAEVAVWLGIAGPVVAIVTFVVGDTTVPRLWELIDRRIRWEEPPNVGDDRVVRGRLSHAHSRDRVVTYALVVAPQRLGVRLLWRLFHPATGLERWIVAASFLEKPEGVAVPPGEILPLTAPLDDRVPLPTWRLWRSYAMVDPLDRRLAVLVRFTRARTVAKPVKKL